MFDSRLQAGEILARKLEDKGYGEDGTVVVAIPRGGVPVGRAVSNELGSPLDVVVTRKIPVPNQPELALGAVGPGGIRVIDMPIVKRFNVSYVYLKVKIEELKKEIAERERRFNFAGSFARSNFARRRAASLEGKTVILVDDGIATGATVEAAIRFLRTKSPARIVLAVPVASRESAEMLESLVDDSVILETPPEFQSVGQFYKDFRQVTDEEVVELLNP